MHPSNSKLHPRISIQPLHVSHHCSKWSYSFLGLKAKINCFRKKIFYLNLWVMEDGLVLAWLMSKWWTPWTYFFWSCWHQCPFVRESIIVILSNHILMHLQIDSILVAYFFFATSRYDQKMMVKSTDDLTFLMSKHLYQQQPKQLIFTTLFFL